MPRHVLATSLYEPVTIEVEGGQIYKSVPLSIPLIREIQALEGKQKKGELDPLSSAVQQTALIFGLEASDVEKIDIRIIYKALEHATAAMTPTSMTPPPDAPPSIPPPVPAPETPASPASEASAEKNLPKPGLEISQ